MTIGTRRFAASIGGFAFGLTAVGSVAMAQAAPPADFAVCSGCHATKSGAPPGIGPNLFGVGGRKAGAVEDFDYSDAMIKYGQIWTTETLSAFIQNPTKTIPGTKMDYPGMNDPATVKAIADYLMSLKN
jgi:cytochrome c